MRVCVLALAIALACLMGSPAAAAGSPAFQASSPDHVAWVAESLTRMQTVKVGMTRSDLMAVFTTEGGTSSVQRRTFVSRDCQYFKVDVRFLPSTRPAIDKDGRAGYTEDDQDVILEISRPYLQFSAVD